MYRLWYIVMALGVVNRLRGTYGWFAKVFAVALTGLVYWLSGSWLLAGLIGVGYWFGEMICGWGDHVGNITGKRWTKFGYFPEDGSDVGTRWLTSVLVYPKLWRQHVRNVPAGLYNWYARTMIKEIKGYSLNRLFGTSVKLKEIETFVVDKAMMYSRVFLVIRGLYWWVLPMVGVGLWISNMPLAMVGLVVIAMVWPISAELGYWSANKWTYASKYYNMVGGWEHQEVWYGVMQTVVFVLIGLSNI